MILILINTLFELDIIYHYYKGSEISILGYLRKFLSQSFKFVHLLAQKPYLEKNYIYSSIIFTCTNPVLLIPSFGQVG